MNNRKKDIVEAIQCLSKSDHNTVFHIFKKHNVNYSQNVNGVFINMKLLSSEVLDDIDLYLQALKESKQKMDQIVSRNDASSEATTSFSDPLGFILTETEEARCDPSGQDMNTMTLVDKSTVQTFCENIKHEQAVSKKSQNKFLAAKKRFARPYLTETKRLEENTWAGCFGLQKQDYCL
jgi:hypothetical protein